MLVPRYFLAAAAVLIAAGSALSAQEPAAGDERPTAVAQPASAAPAAARTPTAASAADETSLAPFADNAAVGARGLAKSAPVPYAPPRRDEHLGTNVMLMIVGGASLLTGAIVSGSASSTGARNAGDVLMIGGAVVGIIGLFRYLR